MASEAEGGRDGWVDRDLLLKTGVGFAVAVAIVYLVGRAVGWGDTLAVLRTADLVWVGVAVVTSLASIVVWARIWQVVLESLGVEAPFRKLVVTFYAATFANYVTPFGQTGGQPFVAYLLARDTVADYEESLASVVTTDLLRLFPFLTAGGLGCGYLLVRGVQGGRILRYATVLLAVAVVVPLGAFVAWRQRRTVRRGLLRVLAPVARRTELLSLPSLRERFDRFYAALGLIADDPRSLAVAAGYAFAGWVLFVLPLYFSGLALGVEIPILLVAFLVAATVLVGAAPLPGGVGAIEGSLVALLVLLHPVTGSQALAITTVYRVTTYWLVIAVGGLATLRVVQRF